MTQYTVVGPRAVAGVAPGGVVELEGDQSGLIAAGHLSPVPATAKAAKPADQKITSEETE